jgi:hypothetical protein
LATKTAINTSTSDHAALTDSVHGLAAGQTIVGVNATQTLTNKTIDADNNTISNLETDNFKAGAIVTTIGVTGSDAAIPTEQASREAIDVLANRAIEGGSTAETVTTKVLTPNGSGGVAWVEPAVSGGLSSKGASTLGSSSTIAMSSSDTASGVAGNCGGGFAVVDMDDDTFSGSSTYPNQSTVLLTEYAYSGTLTGSAQVILITAFNTPTTNGVTLYKSGSDYILSKTAGASAAVTWYVA